MRMLRLSAALLLPITAGVATFSYAQAPTVPEPPALLTVTTSPHPEGRHTGRAYSPGDASTRGATTWHMHPSPPFAYVIEGPVVIESETRPPIEVKADHAIAEPTGKVIRAVNGGTVPTKLVIFYVAPPRTPFLEEVRR